MNFINEYWPLFVVVVIVAVLVYIAATQPKKVREWLLYAVTEAEKALGGGTGVLKLRYVYDMFVAKFPWLSIIITFNRFSYFVDEALKEMDKLLSTNTAVANYVDGN